MNDVCATQLTAAMRSLVDRLDELVAVQRRQAKALELLVAESKVSLGGLEDRLSEIVSRI